MRPGADYKLIFLFLLAVACRGSTHAQEDSATHAPSSSKDMFSIGAGVQHGFIFAHSDAVENTRGSHPTGVEVIFSWQRNDSATWNLCNCFPRKGLLLAYYDYDNRVLGKSATAAYFLEPTYRLTKGSFFAFRGAAGLSYLTDPYDPVRNPSNRSYSTSVSAYLLLGVGLWFQLGKQWWLNTSVNYQHESNGGLRDPNKGINWPTAGLAFSYGQKWRPYYRGVRYKENTWRGRPPHGEVALFGIARRDLDERGRSRRLPLLGVAVQGAKQVGRISNLTIGTELYRDEELRLELRKDSIDAPPVLAGLQAGHQFILGRFLFSQALGVYIFDKTPYNDLLYHRWTLQYRLGDRIGIGFSLKAHRHIADFADLRLGYRFGKKEEK
ncbi:MAG TPA: acyloxyacyl hydrolase [Chitinophagaceae bacterium]